MKIFRWLAFSLIFFLFACQPNIPAIVTIIDGGQIHSVESSERVPLILLTQNGVALQPNDRVLLNGIPVPIDQPMPGTKFIQLQLRHAVTMTVNSPEGQQAIQTSALTVGQAMNEAGFMFAKNDLLDPPAETPITQSLSVTFTPARDLTIYVGENILNVRSAAGTVGQALAQAGIPLIGFDTSFPLENDPLPVDGQIRVVRVYESISVVLKSIPFETQRIESADVALGQEETIQPGVNGLAMIRTRIRYEDGKEVSRKTEDKMLVREPQTRIVAGGSQIVLAPLPIDGAPNDYWLATQMYATVYSPCESGTGGCSYGTASGARAGYGIVAVDYSIYSYLAGMRVYISGYGFATIGDTGGGPIIETMFGVPRTKWIDLGFNDGEMRDMTGWVTVYFLAPAPAEVPYFLK
jgi:uncharacterized protein YabE (DUF348 family)